MFTRLSKYIMLNCFYPVVAS